MNEVTKERVMTTKELAEVLGVTPRTIRDTVNRLNLRKSISQVKINGKDGFVFNEAQAIAIKIELQNHSKIANNGFNTLTISNDLEFQMMFQKMMSYSNEKIKQLQNEKSELQTENKELKESNKTLLEDLGREKSYRSIKSVEMETGKHFKYRDLRNYSKSHGYEIHKAFDQNYGEVNTYHVDVWQAVYGIEL